MRCSFHKNDAGLCLCTPYLCHVPDKLLLGLNNLFLSRLALNSNLFNFFLLLLQIFFTRLVSFCTQSVSKKNMAAVIAAPTEADFRASARGFFTSSGLTIVSFFSPALSARTTATSLDESGKRIRV